MPRRGENIYKRKDGRWEGRFIVSRSISGKAKYKSVYASSYSEVKRKLGECKKEITLNIYGHQYNEYPFSLFCKEWLNAHKKYVKESSYIKYYNVVTLHIVPYLGKIKLKYMTTQCVYCYIQELLAKGSKKGEGLSTKTVSDILSVFKNIMKYIEYHYGDVCFDFHQITVKQHNEVKMRILNHQEMRRLYTYILENQNLINLGILLALSTGIRIGELCAMRWDDIHLNEGELYVMWTMQRIQTKDTLSQTKTKVIMTMPKSECSIRKIPIPQYLISLLKPFECHHNEYFLTGKNQQYIEPRCLEYKFKTLMNINHIENIHFHTLRHTFATQCIELGFDVKCLSEILGHANVNITLNKYVHPTFDLKRENMNKFNQFINVKNNVTMS